MTENLIYYKSPIGLIEIKSLEGKITSLSFVEDKKLEVKLSKVLIKAIKQLDEYFEGKRKIFDLPIKLDGTEFRKKVWKALLDIPYGETFTYKDIAKMIKNDKAYRAVGGANNKNKIGIIIPCHRVIGKSGKLVGYAGGVWRKKWLLNHESSFKKN